jgi:hypothetical protein
MAAYQATAVLGDVLPGDVFVSINAHRGRPDVLTTWLDPSVTDEADPLSVDPALDMFSAGLPYEPGFVAEYRAALFARTNGSPRGAGRSWRGSGGRAPGTGCSACHGRGPTCGSPVSRSTHLHGWRGATQGTRAGPTTGRSVWHRRARAAPGRRCGVCRRRRDAIDCRTAARDACGQDSVHLAKGLSYSPLNTASVATTSRRPRPPIDNSRGTPRLPVLAVIRCPTANGVRRSATP